MKSVDHRLKKFEKQENPEKSSEIFNSSHYRYHSTIMIAHFLASRVLGTTQLPVNTIIFSPPCLMLIYVIFRLHQYF